ncbi:hypothetical protein SLS62_002540 [Diatrype stigma]|uniref:Glucose-methanol-choline oxidoreductase N-terminal domain-containing protein n=1 Tax=Diatrype stigma TaxID=117547 RepID=A0AAN9V0C0_9PEZI
MLTYHAVQRVTIDVTVPRVREQNHLPPNGAQLPAHPPDPNKTYEYIIVGSGAGGSPLAARLAQAGHSVLLIDAGGDHGRLKEVEVPALSIHSSERNEFSWGFFAHHYEDPAQARRDRKYTYRAREGGYYYYYSGTSPPEGAEPLGNFYPRVGALGGCTEHHALITILPADEDWAHIQSLAGGDASWHPENMRAYFRKLEKNRYLPSDPVGAHGYTGWLETALTPLTLIAQDVKVLSMVVAAAAAFGLQTDGLVGEIVRVIDGLLGGLLGKVSLMSLNLR